MTVGGASGSSGSRGEAAPTGGIGSVFAGHEIFEEIGRGGMGIVYQAEETDPDRTVALKILYARDRDDEESSLRFQREIEALIVIDHPNVVAIRTAGRAGGW